MNEERAGEVREPGEGSFGAPEQAWIVVRGVVQGVGFRWFVLQEAQRLGLTGTVRNRSDGTVEIQAAGRREALARLVRVVSRGPALARVTLVEAVWSRPNRRWDEFRVTG